LKFGSLDSSFALSLLLKASSHALLIGASPLALVVKQDFALPFHLFYSTYVKLLFLIFRKYEESFTLELETCPALDST